MLKTFTFSFFFFLPLLVVAQLEHGLVAKYSFNEGLAVNDLNNMPIKAPGVSYGVDRFGNQHSACYLAGNSKSYLNLGTDPVLKPVSGTISIWMKMITEMWSGSGSRNNPIILTKNGPGNDFYEAYNIAYDLVNKRVGATTKADGHDYIVLYSTDSVEANKWYHLVVTFDDNALCFYVNGELAGCYEKKYRTHFLMTDSVMVGYSANVQNNRFFCGFVDDISIYNRVLSADEVKALYEEPDPNGVRNIFKWFLLTLVAAAGVYALIQIITRRLKKELEREKEKNRLQTQVYEMEVKMIKAQMNPHFIFNSMNSIRQFILENDTENANVYLLKFAQLLRNILESNTDEHISVDREVEILETYIALESLRFGHTFSHEIIMDKKIVGQNVRIPPMLIQPFVENAIWHGLLPKKGNRNLSLEFRYVDQHRLACIVDDNGVGRHAAKSSGATRKNKSLGIHFIEHRLELMNKEHGGKYCVTVTDKTDSAGQSTGTRISITMPILSHTLC